MNLNPDIEARIAEAIAFRLNPVQWVGGDGKKRYNVSDMETSHIINCIEMIRSHRMKRQSANGISTPKWLRIFSNELLARDYKALYTK